MEYARSSESSNAREMRAGKEPERKDATNALPGSAGTLVSDVCDWRSDAACRPNPQIASASSMLPAPTSASVEGMLR